LAPSGVLLVAFVARKPWNYLFEDLSEKAVAFKVELPHKCLMNFLMIKFDELTSNSMVLEAVVHQAGTYS
jgi:hypothetical protein